MKLKKIMTIYEHSGKYVIVLGEHGIIHIICSEISECIEKALRDLQLEQSLEEWEQ